MKPIEFELERTIRAPIDQVFARLVDIEGHNDWMADTGSMLRRTRQTSPGRAHRRDDVRRRDEPGPHARGDRRDGVAAHDRLPLVGEVEVGQAQVRGLAELLPAAVGDTETLVRHRAKLVSYGVWRLGTPIWRRFAVKERTITVDALKASFERNPGSAPG